ncbi:hypothetical protein ADUPG1_007257 [Aduncisulcus paluster]|uniref:Uncharacterized protein n=1 Tax=Aduncisulcus paluster TaxID=2918883 RepID=A0ABQ5KPQ0_9EUKA|nr:hypothetical protein ADUPG1_007257 [Aduncisulcus paluster]
MYNLFERLESGKVARDELYDFLLELHGKPDDKPSHEDLMPVYQAPVSPAASAAACPHATMAAGLSVEQRLELSAYKREEKLMKRRIQLQEEQMKECTFQPAVSSTAYTVLGTHTPVKGRIMSHIANNTSYEQYGGDPYGPAEIITHRRSTVPVQPFKAPFKPDISKSQQKVSVRGAYKSVPVHQRLYSLAMSRERERDKQEEEREQQQLQEKKMSEKRMYQGAGPVRSDSWLSFEQRQKALLHRREMKRREASKIDRKKLTPHINSFSRSIASRAGRQSLVDRADSIQKQKAQRIERESQHHVPNRVRERPRSAGPMRISSRAGAPAAFDRLYRDASIRKRRKEEKKQMVTRQTLRTVTGRPEVHHPTYLNHVQAVVRPTDHDYIEKLSRQQFDKRIFTERMKEMEREKEMEECTFQPRLCSNISSVVSTVADKRRRNEEGEFMERMHDERRKNGNHLLSTHAFRDGDILRHRTMIRGKL